MKRAIAIADRAAGLSLRVLALFNLLFVAIFLIALLAAASRAAAQDVVECRGENLIEALASDDPALLETVRAEAADVENGRGILWKIEKANAEPSWLFGTMHMADPRVVTLGSAAEAAFGQASTVVIETTDVLDQQKMMAAMAANPELMMFTDGTTLSSLLSKEDRELVENALSQRGIPPASIQKMKPWMIASLVALPACELARKAVGAPVLDVMLAERAKVEGKALDGLETLGDQLGAMASLPMDFHIRGLVDTLKLGDMADDVIETMIALYMEGDTATLWPLFRAVLPGGDDAETGFAAFEETMVTARNKTMMERSVPFLDKGRAFIAVGALHLPGDQGLVALLRESGYEVTAVR